MDRLISLLAALVGLIALGGAVLVNIRADTQQQALAAQVAELQSALGQAGGVATVSPTASASSAPASSPAEDDGTVEALLALQNRIAALEDTTRTQAEALEAAQTALASQPSIAPLTPVETGASAMPATATSSAVTDEGPTTDCIPLGTRFIGASGDSFPICKTKVVVAVASVSDGIATIRGAGDVPVGATSALSQNCSVSLFSADIASGYAEMRVSCR